MKKICILSSVVILFCILVIITFVGVGKLLNFFLPITPFQGAMLLLMPFCILLLLIPLLLINQKMEQIMAMTEEDYMFWDDEECIKKKIKSDNKSPRSQKKQKKIIVMENSPIIDRNAPCPCGSGDKYKNCCGEKGKSSKNEGE